MQPGLVQGTGRIEANRRAIQTTDESNLSAANPEAAIIKKSGRQTEKRERVRRDGEEPQKTQVDEKRSLDVYGCSKDGRGVLECPKEEKWW